MLRKWKVITLLFIFVALVGCVDKEMKVSSDESKEERKAITEKDVFRKLEEEYDTKLGIYALDTGTNQIVSYRAEDRFAYASTHKVLSVGVLLQQNDINKLEEGILIKEDDLVNYNPITEKHVGEQMTWREISDASIRYSDNAAANHILEQIGGPEGFKKALRDIGDDVTNPERIEPYLNQVKPGETRDTSTPKALATSLYSFTIGDALTKEKQDLLVDWLKRNTTGDNLIRAGVPKGWGVGDKSGSASYGTRNDIGIIWPPNEDPIILAVLSSQAEEDAEANDELIAKATEEVISILK
ncbi:class A beta-lactamase [Virgibacillus proomii]|uniref:class A beta-lactamase n=1 Tax=Virgibacillus proomii TaxID=84407 RepID=UPI001C126D2B|nr:class A beta-lactamase [Virgibacillus proomii]MBU5265663.1 class A beta-lactamase [Virgibacillus proomii]